MSDQYLEPVGDTDDKNGGDDENNERPVGLDRVSQVMAHYRRVDACVDANANATSE